MQVEGITPIMNVSDIGQSLLWFERLGWSRRWTYNDGGSIKDAADGDEHGPANFCAVGSGKYEIFLCRDGQGGRGGAPPKCLGDETRGVWMSLWLESPAAVDAAYREAVDAGALVGVPPEDMPWGVREFLLVHPDGHTFRVGAGLGEE